ncbi:MAG: DUF5074 domain-containing protein [Paludibacteraceae bacterium]
MEKKNFFKLTGFFLIGLLSFTSCSDDDDNNETPAPSEAISGVYIINQGSYGSNNTSVSFLNYDSCKIYNNVFYNANGRKLGDTGQDAVIYGNKMYIAVYNSNTIEVVDKKTCKSIKTLQTKGEQPQNPRDIIAHNGKIYVSMYDGFVAKIDTSSLDFEAFVKVGPNPEEMAIANGYLYVANSDGMNYTNGYANGTTVSKVNLSTFSEEKRITVSLNPCKVCADSKGNIFVISMGNYYDIPATLEKINSADEVTTLSTPATIMAISGTTLYTINAPYGSSEINYVAINTESGDVISNPYLKGETKPANPISIAIDPKDGRILIGSYVSNADYTSDGFVYEYSTEGTFVKRHDAGVGPFGFAF